MNRKQYNAWQKVDHTSLMDEKPERKFDEYEIVAGILLPVSLLVLVAVNIVLGKAWGPDISKYRSELFNEFTRPVIVGGFVLIKLALALGMFVWFWMANRLRFERLIITLQTVSLGIAALGVGLLLVALFF